MKKTLPKTKMTLRMFVFGNKGKNGLLRMVPFYFIMICAGFIFLYPLIGALVTSLLSPEDLVDPTVKWIPTQFYLGNYIQAYKTLNFLKSFFHSLLMSVIPAVLQTAAAAVIGFGLARFRFPGKTLMVLLAVGTFFVPQQVTLIPRYLLFDKYEMLNTVWSVYLPAITGQGINSAIFILVFMQFFRSYPLVLDEAAELDGANKWTVFFKIGLPMAKSAIVLSLLFSFVWYWNETLQSNLLFGEAYITLPMMLQQFTYRFEAMFGADAASGGITVSTAISMAGTILSILPVLILYMFMQKQFVESIEKTGITGE